MINLDRLVTWLNQAGIQTTNIPLYQVIVTLIKAAQEFQKEQAAVNSGTSGILNNATFLTVNNELGSLPFSRILTAGSNVAFDDTVFGVRTVNVSLPSGYWTLLTDGNIDETDFIFASGDAISVFVPL
jgi:hypothetical protein